MKCTFEMERIEVVDMLLQHGAKVDLADEVCCNNGTGSNIVTINVCVCVCVF